MKTELQEVVDRVRLGESMRAIAMAYREAMLVDMGFDPEDAPEDLFQKETMRFMNEVCRHMGDRHSGDSQLAAALVDWVRLVDEYDAFDTLLSHYDFEGRESVIARGHVLFPGPLTAHWGESAGGS